MQVHHLSVKELKLAGAAAVQASQQRREKRERGIPTISSYQTERVHGRSFGHFFCAIQGWFYFAVASTA
jgi:hypothetical protein